jgi:hypothetical protein
MEHRAWMYGIWRNSSTFLIELTNFLEVAQKHTQISRTKQICCPCCDCCNKIVWEDINSIKMHLIKRGFVKGYKTWSHHHYVKTSNRSRSICNGPLTPVTSTHICNGCCLAPVTYKRARTIPGLASTTPVANVDF